MERLDAISETVKLSSSVEDAQPSPGGESATGPERMPFTIRIVDNEIDLDRAVRLRRAAYGRHVPAFAENMTAEECDLAMGTTILLAEAKFDRLPLGTIRIQTNDFAPLAVEHSVTLPEWCSSGRLAEATRLSVANGGPGRMVKMMLFKALFLYCEQREIDWLVITARSPIDREYETMQFRDVLEERQFIPMAHIGGLPHRVMAGKVSSARQRWKEARHPLYRFVFETDHPDIDLTDVRCSTFRPDTVRFDEHAATDSREENGSDGLRRDLQYS